MAQNCGRCLLHDCNRSIVNLCNSYSTQAILKKSQNREKRIFQKMIKGSGTKKSSWYESQATNVGMSVPKLPFPVKACDSRRMSMLNKVFMRHITDMMGTGEVASWIVGRGLQISRVKISTDFKNLSVYWLSQNPKDDAQIEKLLVGCAGHLRHELSQLQVVGLVPRIEFVKDRQFTKLIDVDHLLTQADYGDDYVAVHAHYHYNSNFTQNSEVSPAISRDKPLPPMRMNVLGLDHALIMNKIQKALKKAQASHRKEPYFLEIESYATGADHDVELSSSENQQLSKRNLSTFLIQRQAAKERAMKKAQSYRPELELCEVEESDNEKYLENFLSHIEDKDFMVDDDEKGT